MELQKILNLPNEFEEHTAARTDCVAKMVVVLELLTPLSITQLSSLTCTSDEIAELLLEQELSPIAAL
jgi:hypothetical protein